MSAEDRLRQLLQEEGEDVAPAGDGLRRIEARLAARRARRARLVPAIALAGVVAVAGAAALTVSLTDDGDLNERKLPKTHQGSPQPEPSAQARPTADPSSTVTTSAAGTPVWPFTTDTEAADWVTDHGNRPWAGDPVAVTAHLVSDYLELPAVVTRKLSGDATTTVVAVSAAGHAVSQVRLVRVGRAAQGPWSVTGAVAPTLTVTSPADGAPITSPTTVVGTVSDPDQSVHLRLLTDSLVAEAYAPAGRDLPWTQPLQWTDLDWSVGVLAANTFNGKGDLLAITLTAVRRSGGDGNATPVAGTSLVALDQGHVVTVDAVTGSLLEQISYPPAGSSDLAPDRGGKEDVVWVRVASDGCTSSIVRAGIRHGDVGLTLNARPIAVSLPSLSYGGRSIGWVEEPCGGGDKVVVVRGPDGNESTHASSTEAVNDLDVRDDGTVLLDSGGRLVLPGCTGHAPAWDGQVAVAFADCAGGWQLLRYTPAWTIESATSVAGVPAPIVHTAVADRQVLVAMEHGGVARLIGDRVVALPNALRWGSADW